MKNTKNKTKRYFKLFLISIFAISSFLFFSNSTITLAASTQIPQSQLKINSFDSQQLPNYPATAAIDSNASTFWAYAFNPVSIRTPHPHHITLDLGSSYPVEGFRYLPRQDGSLYGTITKYELYVSDNIADWGAPVSTGTLAGNSSLKEIAFTQKIGRYVKFVSLADAMNSVAVAVAEIQAIGNGVPNKDINYNSIYGNEITVGLWSYTRSDLANTAFEIEANQDYRIKDSSGKILGKISANSITKVKYYGDKKLRIYNSLAEIIIDKEVFFESSDGNNTDIIFDVHRPNSSYDRYRGKIKLRYSDASQNIWVINILPLEQYIWGIGEITGTGDEDYNRAMTTAFRTYGYWKILYSTKYASEGFKVDATPGNQIYRGYEWEIAYPRIKQAAIYTQGKVALYGNEIALSPFSSWTDGRTRSFEERWGSKDYPWCQSVPDPYGKNSSMTTDQLFAAGNHMVGISAHGALNLATNYSRNWDDILTYYLTGITITKIY